MGRRIVVICAHVRFTTTEAAAELILNPVGGSTMRDNGLQGSADVVRCMVGRCPSFERLGSNMASLDEITSWATGERGAFVFTRADAAAVRLPRVGKTYFTEGALRLVLVAPPDPQTKACAQRSHRAVAF